MSGKTKNLTGGCACGNIRYKLGNDPLIVRLGQPTWRGHPVQRLIRARVAVNGDAAISLDQDQPGRQRQVRCQSARVVDAAPGDDEPHVR